MGNVIKRVRRGIAVTWLKHKKRKINSNPKMLFRYSGRKGRIRRKIIVEDKYIERRMRELTGLMEAHEKSIRRTVKDVSERGDKINRSDAMQLTKPYREYKQELIELFERLEEIKDIRKKMKQKARERARRIAGKEPRYIDATVVSKDNPSAPRLTK